MMTKEKIAALKKQLRKGVPAGELMQTLKEEGYSEEEIREVFKPKKYDMRSWYLIFAIIALLLGIGDFLSNKRFLLLLSSVALFSFYYREQQRLKSQ